MSLFQPNSQNLKAIIFDMDGVLIDSEPVYIEKFRSFLLENNCTIDEVKLLSTVGANSQMTWDTLATLWYEPISGDVLHKHFRQIYPDFEIPYGRVAFPGITDFIKILYEKGFLIAVASSSSTKAIMQMIKELAIGEYVSEFISGEMFNESKPNPEIYLHILEKLGLSADECIAVEDSPYGIAAAKAAGLKVAAVKDTRFGFDQSLADYVIEHTTCLFENL